MRHPYTKTSTHSDLNELEDAVQAPLMELRPSMWGSGFQALQDFISPLEKSTAFAVLVRVGIRQNAVRKAHSLLHTSMYIWLLELVLTRQGNSIVGRFGVYPTAEDPVAIYSLDSRAERYINKHVLPSLPGGLNGLFRRIIMKIAKCHPSVGGIIIIARKN